MYIEASFRNPGDSAALVSREFRTGRTACLSFWYHMFGTNIQRLEVLVWRGTNSRESIWIRESKRLFLL